MTSTTMMPRRTLKADMLKLQLTVLSFDKLQLAYPVYVDDEDEEVQVDEDDFNNDINSQYDRIISAHVGVSSPYFYQTIQPSPTSSISTDTAVFPPSEGYELSLSTESKEPVAFYDHKEGTEEIGVAFH